MKLTKKEGAKPIYKVKEDLERGLVDGIAGSTIPLMAAKGRH